MNTSKIIFNLLVILAILSACSHNQATNTEKVKSADSVMPSDSINSEARLFTSERGDYTCDLLFDSIRIELLFPEKYFDSDPDDYLEPLCAHNEQQYVIYKGTNKLAQNYADYYNALLMCHNLISDRETAVRFGEEDPSVYPFMANAILKMDCSIIRNDTLRQLARKARMEMAAIVRKQSDASYEEALDPIVVGFISEKVNSILQQSLDKYNAYMDRKDYYSNFDAMMAQRGTSDKQHQQELLSKMFLAQTPAERHVYAIEFAHSDSADSDFLVGAAVLNREFINNAQYSPYLSEMWRTWRASISTLFGVSSWSYIPNLIYNQKRAQVAETIIKYIEENPHDFLAQGVLIDLAGCENISRHGSILGNAAMVEQMNMFPEWEMKHNK